MKQVAEVVMTNKGFARRLHYLGIDFLGQPQSTLEQLAKQKGLELEKVIYELEAPEQDGRPELPLTECPLTLIIEYLKHAHHRFVKDKLPFIDQLVKRAEVDEKSYDSVCRDLKVLYPLFYEDFINHIYEEEDTLFKYIIDIDQVFRNQMSADKVLPMIEKSSLTQFAREHVLHDDEMHGIRKITGNYKLTDDASLTIKVLFSELLSLEQDLKEHARIENEILFPKAIDLEQTVLRQYGDKGK